MGQSSIATGFPLTCKLCPNVLTPWQLPWGLPVLFGNPAFERSYHGSVIVFYPCRRDGPPHWIGPKIHSEAVGAVLHPTTWSQKHSASVVAVTLKLREDCKKTLRDLLIIPGHLFWPHVLERLEKMVKLSEATCQLTGVRHNPVFNLLPCSKKVCSWKYCPSKHYVQLMFFGLSWRKSGL